MFNKGLAVLENTEIGFDAGDVIKKMHEDKVLKEFTVLSVSNCMDDDNAGFFSWLKKKSLEEKLNCIENTWNTTEKYWQSVFKDASIVNISGEISYTIIDTIKNSDYDILILGLSELESIKSITKVCRERRIPLLII